MNPAFDDGMDAREVMMAIERELGLDELPEQFWQQAYERSFVDVVRALEREQNRAAPVLLTEPVAASTTASSAARSARRRPW